MKDLPASIRQRLLSYSKAQEVDTHLVFTRFAAERFLYRLAQSPYSERFVLKGAMLLLVWFAETVRPTRDVDLLGFGSLSDDELEHIFAEVCAQPVEPDGMQFGAETIAITPIREQGRYGGRRVTLIGELSTARLHVQIDVGVGDKITPPAEWLEYPSLLDLPRPRLRAYRPETSLAEKLHAMVVLDLQNSRMKDFYDLWMLSERNAFRGEQLAAAVHATFSRRGSSIPTQTPTALTDEFARHPDKERQWQAFISKVASPFVPEDLVPVIAQLGAFLEPVLESLRMNIPFAKLWPPGGPWQSSDTEPAESLLL